MTDNLPERIPPRYLSHADLDLMFRIAKAHAMSKFFEDAAEEMKAFVIIEAGREMGLLPFQAMQSIDVIKGKPVVNSNFMAQCVKQHPHYDYRIIEHTNERCELAFFHDGVEIGKSVFDTEDAKRAELDRPGRNGTTSMYVKYPRNMLFARAMSNGVAFHCPDALGVRTYVEGELEDEYLETKAQREAKRAEAALLLEQVKAGAAGTALPAPPVAPGEEVVGVEPEPEMDTAVKEPMTGTASATLDPPAETIDQATATAITTAQSMLQDRQAAGSTQAERLAAHTTEEAAKVAPESAVTEAPKEEKPKRSRKASTPAPEEHVTPSPEEMIAQTETGIKAVREFVINGLQGADRTDCHEWMKFLGWWGENGPKELWMRFGKKALAWDTLKPCLQEAVEAELQRQAAEAEPEPPFGGEPEQIEGQEQIVDVDVEPKAPWEEES